MADDIMFIITKQVNRVLTLGFWEHVRHKLNKIYNDYNYTECIRIHNTKAFERIQTRHENKCYKVLSNRK